MGGRRTTMVIVAGIAAAGGLAADGGLAEVQSIFIAEPGTSPQAPPLREALAAELRAAGFTVVDEPADADAVLSGTVTMRGSQKRPRLVFTEVVLSGDDGETLWGAKVPARRQLKRIARGIAAAQRHVRWRSRTDGQ